MKKFLAYAISGVVGLLISAAVYAAPVATFTGPTGTNPIDPPNILGGMNTMLNNLNGAISNGAALGTSVGIFSNGGFQIQSLASTSTNMTIGARLPNGGLLVSNTAKFFLTFFDSQGVQSYIPVWQ